MSRYLTNSATDKVFPNPATNMVSIEWNYSPGFVEAQLEVSSYASGLYPVAIRCSNSYLEVKQLSVIR